VVRRIRPKPLALIVVAVLLVPVPKLVIGAWSVRVLDHTGIPLSGIRVWQTWENYTFQLSGSAESLTNTEGRVIFQKHRRFAPVAYWGIKAVSNVVGFGMHAGFGTFGRVWISDPKLNDLVRVDSRLMESTAANCSDASCTVANLESVFRLPAQ